MSDSTSKAERLEAVADRIRADHSLQIARDATNAVPGEGSAESGLLFIGEAPGAEEDKQGRPFVGAAGKFLAEMLGLIGLTREDVFITNVLKFRPPGNRDPEPEEITSQWPYLQQQIEIIDPLLIVTLGRHAMNRFLPSLRISEVHGQPKAKDARVYYPLYHPAAALYNGGMRQVLIDDFRRIPEVLAKVRERRTAEESQTSPTVKQEQLF